MSLWSGAWVLTRRDITKDKLIFLWGFFICIAIIMTIISFEVNQIAKMEAIYSTRFITNMIVVLMFQMLGLGMGRSYLTKYYRTDLFTKRTSYLHMMPVSVSQIILARYLHHTIILVFMNIVIFSGIGIWGDLFQVYEFTAVQFIQLILTWIGYSSLFGSIYIFLELGVHGKRYFIGSSIIFISFMIPIIICTFVYQISIWHEVLGLVKGYGYMSSSLSLVVGGLGTYLMIKLLHKRMKTRDLYL